MWIFKVTHLLTAIADFIGPDHSWNPPPPASPLPPATRLYKRGSLRNFPKKDGGSEFSHKKEGLVVLKKGEGISDRMPMYPKIPKKS